LIPAFIEELKNEICYASRKSLIIFDKGTASFYDQIIPALASLIGCKFGLTYIEIYCRGCPDVPEVSEKSVVQVKIELVNTITC
jgi:hypothetical protein